MKEEIYAPGSIVSQFPDWSEKIIAGDFKVLRRIDGAGTVVAYIARFPNLAICGPDMVLINDLDAKLFASCAHSNIRFTPFGILGLDIVGTVS